jgi:hypothetical protein
MTDADPYVQIERTLERSLERDPRQYANLNELPLELVDEARKLDGVLPYIFLLRHVDGTLRLDLQSFVEDVVRSGQDPARWRVGRVLYPDLESDDLLTRDVRGVLGALSPEDGEDWRQFPAERLPWERGMAYSGAPAVVRPSLPHSWQAPSHVGSFLLTDGLGLAPVRDVAVATRRWVASRLAYATRNRPIPSGIGPASRAPESRESLAAARQLEAEAAARGWVSASFPKVDQLSADALVAVVGLLAEQVAYGDLSDSQDAVPGFRGPDDWYTAR